jgi:hypothetical protein
MRLSGSALRNCLFIFSKYDGRRPRGQRSSSRLQAGERSSVSCFVTSNVG